MSDGDPWNPTYEPVRELDEITPLDVLQALPRSWASNTDLVLSASTSSRTWSELVVTKIPTSVEPPKEYDPAPADRTIHVESTRGTPYRIRGRPERDDVALEHRHHGDWAVRAPVTDLSAVSPRHWDHDEMFRLRYEEQLSASELYGHTDEQTKTVPLILHRLGIHETGKRAPTGTRLETKLKNANPDDLFETGGAPDTPDGDDSWKAYYTAGGEADGV